MRRITAADFSPSEGDFLDQEVLIEEVAADGWEGECITLPANTMVLAVKNSDTQESCVSEYTFRTPEGEFWRANVERMSPGCGWLVGARVEIVREGI